MKTIKRKKIWFWSINVIVLFTIWLVMHPVELCGDAESYWIRSGEFTLNGKFSFLNYSNLLRGYFFPFLLFVQRGAGLVSANRELVLWAFGYAMLVTTIMVCQFPWYAKKIFGKKLYIYQIIILEIIFCVFWEGVLLYPLSDLYALFFLNCAIILFYKLNHYKQKETIVPRWILGGLMGACVYITYSIRAMYSFFAIFIFLFFIFQNRKSNVKIQMGVICSILLGAFLFSVPQIIINQNVSGSYSPLVLGIRDGKKINNQQLYWGLYYSRYETYIGDDEVYPKAGVIFEDKVGKEIIEKEGIEELSVASAIKLYLKYPFDIIGIYGRHMLNAMDNRFPELYITDLYRSRYTYIVGNYLIWFFFVFFLFSKERLKKEIIKNEWIEKWQYLFLASISSLVMLAGAIEIRFFLPIYSLVYLYVIVHFSRKNIVMCWKKYGFKIVILGIIGLVIYISFSGNTMAMLQEGGAILF